MWWRPFELEVSIRMVVFSSDGLYVFAIEEEMGKTSLFEVDARPFLKVQVLISVFFLCVCNPLRLLWERKQLFYVVSSLYSAEGWKKLAFLYWEKHLGSILEFIS